MGILQTSNIAALTSAMGDVMSDFGGLRMSLVTSQGNIGDAQITLQRVAGWPTSGIVGIGADVYAYSGISGTALTGITYQVGGTSHTGLAAAYAVNTAATDLSRTHSTLDQVKNGYFLGTATDDDLAILGRNLGVPKLPIVRSDADYRALIKALAYAPRGTTYAIESALNALLGAGNFAIHQTPARPATVIVTAPYTALNNASTVGQTYLEGNSAVNISNQTFTSANIPTGTKQIAALKVAGTNGAPPSGQDFLTTQGTSASVTGNTVTLPGYAATPNSNGNKVIIYGSTATRTGGGDNTGSYFISGVAANQAAPATVTVVQDGGTGTVSATGVLTSSSNQFIWPHDLGKTIVIASGAAAGTYTIAKIYDPYQTGLFDCAQYITPIRLASNSIQLSATPASAAPSAPFVVQPSFVNESNLKFAVGGDGIAPDGTFTRTVSLPSNGAYSLDAYMADGAMLAGSDSETYGTPLYLDEPFSEIEGYTDALVVAGVTLEFDFT